MESTGKKMTLTQDQYVDCVIAMQKNQALFMVEKPCAEVAAEMMAKFVGFPVPPSAISKIKRKCGLEWNSKHKPTTPKARAANARMNAVRVLMMDLLQLRRELGSEPTQPLKNLKEAFDDYTAPKLVAS